MTQQRDRSNAGAKPSDSPRVFDQIRAELAAIVGSLAVFWRFVRRHRSRIFGGISLYAIGGAATGLGLFLDSPASFLLLSLGLGLSLWILFQLYNALVQLTGATRTRIKPTMWFGIVLQAMTILGLAWASANSSGVVALVAAWVWALGLTASSAALVSLSVVRERQESSRRHRRTAAITSLGVVFMAAAAILAAWHADHDLALVTAFVVGIFGLSLTILGVISLSATAPRRWALIGSTTVATAGVFTLLLLALGQSVVAAIPGLVLIGAGLVPLSNATPKVVKDSKRWRVATWFLLGSGIGAVVTASFSRAEWPLTYSIGVLLFTALIAFALVSEVSAIALTLLAGSIIAMALHTPESGRGRPESPKQTAHLSYSEIRTSREKVSGATNAAPTWWMTTNVVDPLSRIHTWSPKSFVCR